MGRTQGLIYRVDMENRWGIYILILSINTNWGLLLKNSLYIPLPHDTFLITLLVRWLIGGIWMKMYNWLINIAVTAIKVILRHNIIIYIYIICVTNKYRKKIWQLDTEHLKKYCTYPYHFEQRYRYILTRSTLNNNHNVCSLHRVT